jgi:hypothetical protein
MHQIVGRKTMKENRDLLLKFIESIIIGKNDPYSKVIAVLEARGFEFNHENNLCCDPSNRQDPEDCDYEYLHYLLNSQCLGFLENRSIKLTNPDISINDLANLFIESHPSEQWYRSQLNPSYSSFSKKTTLVPVKVLDSCIARLVKACNLIDISTICCCDGHALQNHRDRCNRSIIEFSEKYSRIWFAVLLEAFIRPRLKLKCCWCIDESHNRCRIKPRNDNMVELYLEIQQVAKFLQDKKSFFVLLKKELVSKTENNRQKLHDRWNIDKKRRSEENESFEEYDEADDIRIENEINEEHQKQLRECFQCISNKVAFDSIERI